jgi:hypothetical protein
MVLMLFSSVHSIGFADAQRTGGPPVPYHPPQHVSAIIIRGWVAAPRVALVIFRLAKERQFGFIIIRARPSVRFSSPRAYSAPKGIAQLSE